jgi:hypothetical protein
VRFDGGAVGRIANTAHCALQLSLALSRERSDRCRDDGTVDGDDDRLHLAQERGDSSHGVFASLAPRSLDETEPVVCLLDEGDVEALALATDIDAGPLH